jgi:hypothetical protein
MKFLSLLLILLLVGCSKPGSDLKELDNYNEVQTKLIHEVVIPESGSISIGSKEDLGENIISSVRLSPYLNFSISGDDHFAEISNSPSRALIIYERLNGKVYAFSFAGQSASLESGQTYIDLPMGISSWVRIPVSGNYGVLEASVNQSPLVVNSGYVFMSPSQVGEIEIKADSNIIGSFSVGRSESSAVIGEEVIGELVINGGFEEDLNGWIDSSVGPSMAIFNNGRIELPIVSNADFARTYQDMTVEPNTDYVITFSFDSTLVVDHYVAISDINYENVKMEYIGGIADSARGFHKAIFNTGDLSTIRLSLGPLSATNGATTLFYDNVSIKDMSSQLVGPNLVSNGDFSNNLVGWQDNSVGTGTPSVSSGVLMLSNPATSNYGRIHQTITGLEVNKSYYVEFDVLDSVGGVLACITDETDCITGTPLIYISASGKSGVFVAESTSHNLVMSVNFTGFAQDRFYDNISIREIE